MAPLHSQLDFVELGDKLGKKFAMPYPVPAPAAKSGNVLWQNEFLHAEKRWIINQAIYNEQRARKGCPLVDIFPFDVRNVDVERLLYRYMHCDELLDDGLDVLLKDMATAEEILPCLREGKARATMSIAPQTDPMPDMMFIRPGICRKLKFWHVGFRVITDEKDLYVTIDIMEGGPDPKWEGTIETVRLKKEFDTHAAAEAVWNKRQDDLIQMVTLLICMIRVPQFNGLDISQIEYLARALGNPVQYGDCFE